MSGGNYVGGLIGSTDGTVSRSYATGAVTGILFYAGGLAGSEGGDALISQSYATGTVAGGVDTGGLVGYQNYHAVIGQSYATGAVRAPSTLAGWSATRTPNTA